MKNSFFIILFFLFSFFNAALAAADTAVPKVFNMPAKTPESNGTFVICMILPQQKNNIAFEFIESVKKMENSFDTLIVFLDSESSLNYDREEDEEAPFAYESLQDILDKLDDEKNVLVVSVSFFLTDDKINRIVVTRGGSTAKNSTWAAPLEIVMPFFNTLKDNDVSVFMQAGQNDLTEYIDQWDYDFPVLTINTGIENIASPKMINLLFDYADKIIKSDLKDFDRNYFFYQTRGKFIFISEFMLVCSALGAGALILFLTLVTVQIIHAKKEPRPAQH
ncbi:hypothetical protein AGMMS50212_05000 [Spirochaetia bacterium]|nr:hypothetical protein AGMMS50212_05000 [Spirochaetia bacterium]